MSSNVMTTLDHWVAVDRNVCCSFVVKTQLLVQIWFCEIRKVVTCCDVAYC